MGCQCCWVERELYTCCRKLIRRLEIYECRAARVCKLRESVQRVFGALITRILNLIYLCIFMYSSNVIFHKVPFCQ